MQEGRKKGENNREMTVSPPSPPCYLSVHERAQQTSNTFLGNWASARTTGYTSVNHEACSSRFSIGHPSWCDSRTFHRH
jgi:hypothetical protein